MNAVKTMMILIATAALVPGITRADTLRLRYSTYLGGSSTTNDKGFGITLDSQNRAYLTGDVASSDFPTLNPYQAVYGGGTSDIFISCLDSSGSNLLYSTYLGGSGNDTGRGIVLDTADRVYLTGYSSSPDFPTENPYQAGFGGGDDAVVVCLSSSGSALVYSSYLGGTGDDYGQGLSLDSSDRAFVAGYTSSGDFPTENPYQAAYGAGNYDAFVTALAATGSAIVYSTYLGGDAGDYAWSIALSTTNRAYLAAETLSDNFPTVNPYQSTREGSWDIAVVCLSSTGSSLIYSTYFGGGDVDGTRGIALGSFDQMFLTGYTVSSDFPTHNAYQPGYGGGASDAVAFVFSGSGSSLIFSTYLGGSGYDRAFGAFLSLSDQAHLTGRTESPDFPTVNPYQASLAGVDPDVFIVAFVDSGTSLDYSSYLGGSGADYGRALAVDLTGVAYLTGYSWSVDFPTWNPYQPENRGSANAFVSKLELGPPSPTPTATPSTAKTVTPSVSPTPSVTPTPFGYRTPSPTATATPSITPTPTTTPTPSFAWWYIPAGGTEINGFAIDEIISVTNPTGEIADIEITAVDELGVITKIADTINAESRYTTTLADLVLGTRGENNDSVSLIIRDINDRVVMADRSMYWNPAGVTRGGGHNSVGSHERSNWWYLPEGATHVFDEYIHVLNPDPDYPAEVAVTFMNMAGQTWTVQSTVGPESNWTIHANEHVTVPGSVATTVESLYQAVLNDAVPVVAERTMYWDSFWSEETDIRWIDGHASLGTTRQSTKWYIAEGATHHIFDCFILIMNPSQTETAEAKVTFMNSQGGVQEENYSIPPHTRETVWVDQVMTYEGSFSAEIESTNGVFLMVERAMYWEAGGIQWAGGHDSIGATRLAPVWYLPEGATDIFDEYILLSNPDPVQDGEVDVTFYFETRPPEEITVVVPAQKRVTVHVNDYHVTGAISTRVEETTEPFEQKLPIIAERAMYWDPPPPDGVYWGGGHATIGIPVWTEEE